MDDRKDRQGKLLLGRPFTRRRILQGSLMSGVAVAGASLLPAMPRQARADAPKKGGNLRVAILGGFKGAADIGMIDGKSIILVPRMGEDKLTAYDLEQL